MRFARPDRHDEEPAGQPEAGSQSVAQELAAAFREAEAVREAALAASGDELPSLPARAPRRFWILSSGSTDSVAAPIAPEEASDPLAAFSPESEIGERRTRRARWPLDRWIAVAATFIALAEGALLLRGVVPLSAFPAAEGTLRVSSTPAGAEVLVDGTPRGAAPIELRLPAGTHRVQVKTADAVREIDADLRAGAEIHQYVAFGSPEPAAVVAATAGSAASLDVLSDPPGARVSIDGEARGATPLQLADLSPGQHDIVLSDSAGSVSRRVTLAAGVTSSLVVAMPKPNTTASGWMRMQLPIPAQIYEGDALLGTTEIDRLMLPAGRHSIRLVNRALNFEAVQTVDIAAGQTRVVIVPLPNGRLSVNALPWARVSVDGVARGETPIGNLAVPIGTHEIVLRHPQFGEQRRSVTVTLGGVTRLGVDLRQ